MLGLKKSSNGAKSIFAGNATIQGKIVITNSLISKQIKNEITNEKVHVIHAWGNFFSSSISALTAVIALIIAFLQYIDKEKAVNEKEMALAQKEKSFQEKMRADSAKMEVKKILLDQTERIKNERDSLLLILASLNKENNRYVIKSNFKIRGIYITKLFVHKNDKVSLEATGVIELGKFTGASGPNGIESGVLGLPISNSYRIVSEFNFGVLMYRIGNNDSWIAVGSKNEFIAKESGYLIFQINDSEQGDNQGELKVSVKISPSV